MTAPHDGARGDARKRHDAPTCLVCGNSVAVDASALAAAKAEGRAEGLDVTALALLLHDHMPETNLPPLLVSGCKCGWGSEVFAHSAHQANEIAKHYRAALGDPR